MARSNEAPDLTMTRSGKTWTTHMRRRHTWREKLVCLGIGALIGLLAGLGYILSVKQHQHQTAASLQSEEAPVVLAAYSEPIEEETEAPLVNDPEPYNDPDIPDEIEAAAEAAAEAYDFEPEFLEAIAFYESAYATRAVNGGCYGLMQISTYWHADRMERLGVTESQIWEAGPNMMVAADYLRELFGRHSDPYWVLMTYNGDSNADAYLEGKAGPSEYARLVQELTFERRNRHGKR